MKKRSFHPDNKFYDAFHKMNENINAEERAEINNYRHTLWIFADKILDISRLPSMQSHNLSQLAEELKFMINAFPRLEGENDLNTIIVNLLTTKK